MEAFDAKISVKSEEKTLDLASVLPPGPDTLLGSNESLTRKAENLKQRLNGLCIAVQSVSNKVDMISSRVDGVESELENTRQMCGATYELVKDLSNDRPHPTALAVLQSLLAPQSRVGPS